MKPCDRATARVRLREAREFLETSLLYDASSDAAGRAVGASNAVLAAIAASDAACCWVLGQRNDDRHDAAPRLLAQVRGARPASNALARVLSIKSKVQYVGGRTTVNDLVSSQKWAGVVVAFAESILD